MLGNDVIDEWKEGFVQNIHEQFFDKSSLKYAHPCGSLLANASPYMNLDRMFGSTERKNACKHSVSMCMYHSIVRGGIHNDIIATTLHSVKPSSIFAMVHVHKPWLRP